MLSLSLCYKIVKYAFFKGKVLPDVLIQTIRFIKKTLPQHFLRAQTESSAKGIGRPQKITELDKKKKNLCSDVI